MRAFRQLLERGASNPVFSAVVALEADHRRIIGNIDAEYRNFPRPDEKFHRTIIDDLGNRFIKDFFELVAVIFHYHYRRNIRDEHERNLNAARQKLAIILAPKAGDSDQAAASFRDQLKSARETLPISVPWDSDA